MSRLKELIDELCPDGVEYKRLDELFDIRGGYTPSKKNPEFWEGGIHPWFVMEDIRRDGNILTDSAAHVTDAALKKGGLFPANSLIVATSATIGVHALIEVDFLCNQRFACMTRKPATEDSLDIKFAYYAFDVLDRWCLNNTDTGNFATVNSNALKAYRIPVPPIEVQREIVLVLDAMQELDDVFDSELERRDEQLWQLRNRVYSDSRFELEPLGNIGKFERGRRFTRTEMNGAGVGCVHYGDIYTDYKYFANEPLNRLDENIHKQLRFATKGDVIIAATSENAEDVCTAIAWLGDEDVAIHDDCQKFCHDQNPLYMAMFFNSGPFIRQKQRFITESKVVRVAGDEMAQIEIPLPPRGVQDRIAHTMLQSIGLMNAIEEERSARRKQFEYYRDKLLDFSEKAVS